MPWSHGDDYMAQTNAELKHLLLLRRLPFSGNKTKMASRMIRYDAEHPFPFQRLPPEIRNMIYKLVSSMNDLFFSRGLRLPLKGHTEGTSCFDGFENIMVHSSLFRVSRQTRLEGLAIFYQHHDFILFVEHGGCFLAIQAWLDNIGFLGRSNLRYLQIRYQSKCRWQDTDHMDIIHWGLTEKATVAYVPRVAESLWRIGYIYSSREPGRAPVFTIDSLDPQRTHFTALRYTTYSGRPASLPRFQILSHFDNCLKYALVFNPGESWFGPRIYY